MHLLISLLAFRPRKIGGTETYLRRMLPHLADRSGDDRVTLLMHRGIAGELAECGAERVVIDAGDRLLACSRFAESVMPHRARRVERAIARCGADVVLFPQQSIYPKVIAAPCVLTVHDVLHLISPGSLPMIDRIFRRGTYARSLRGADRIIAISRFTQRCLIERAGVTADRITVVPHGVDPVPPDGIAPWTGETAPYLYYPAVTNPHKNHVALLRSFAALAASGSWPYRLMLSGARTRHWRALAREIRRLGLVDRVRHLGLLPHVEVLSVMRGAAAVVFPSLFEGFGLPIVEAAQVGTRAITSRLDVFEEIGVPAERRIDFDDPAQLARALEGEASPSLLVAPLTWAETAERTLEVMRGEGRKGGA